jgi:hypothetical protein
MRATCKSCGAPILWTITERGKRMPLDAAPTEDGTVEVIGTAFGSSLGMSRVLSGDTLTAARAARAPLRRSHFAHCPQADEWRRPSKPRKRARA